MNMEHRRGTCYDDYLCEILCEILIYEVNLLKDILFPSWLLEFCAICERCGLFDI